MKFNCGPTWTEYVAQQAEWHDFFTLWPRRVASGDCRWLEVIERRRVRGSGMRHNYWVAEYRAKGKKV